MKYVFRILKYLLIAAASFYAGLLAYPHVLLRVESPYIDDFYAPNIFDILTRMKRDQLETKIRELDFIKDSKVMLHPTPDAPKHAIMRPGKYSVIVTPHNDMRLSNSQTVQISQVFVDYGVPEAAGNIQIIDSHGRMLREK